MPINEAGSPRVPVGTLRSLRGLSARLKPMPLCGLACRNNHGKRLMSKKFYERTIAR